MSNRAATIEQAQKDGFALARSIASRSYDQGLNDGLAVAECIVSWLGDREPQRKYAIEAAEWGRKAIDAARKDGEG